MSLRSSFALASSLALLFVACGGDSQTAAGDGTGGASSTTGGSNSGGSGGNNLAGDTGAGGSEGNPAQKCAPFDTGVCIGPGACVGGRECSPDGMSWSRCDCGSSTGGTSSGGATATGRVPGTGGAATGGSATGGDSTGGTSTGGMSTGGAATGGDSSGGAATGGTSTGGAATGGVSSGGSGGTSTGGVATGGDGTGGTGGDDPGISVGGSTCVGRPTFQQWDESSNKATGDQVRYKCTAAQAACAGQQVGVDLLFECNQTDVPNCSQSPEAGSAWTFALDCAPYRDSLVDCSRAPQYVLGASTNFVTSVCNGGTPCSGATSGLTYMFECVDPYRPNCGETNPGSNDWENSPWQRVGRCE